MTTRRGTNEQRATTPNTQQETRKHNGWHNGKHRKDKQRSAKEHNHPCFRLLFSLSSWPRFFQFLHFYAPAFFSQIIPPNILIRPVFFSWLITGCFLLPPRFFQSADHMQFYSNSSGAGSSSSSSNRSSSTLGRLSRPTCLPFFGLFQTQKRINPAGGNFTLRLRRGITTRRYNKY